MYTEDEVQFLAKAQAGFKREYKIKKFLKFLSSLIINLALVGCTVFIIFTIILDVNTIYGTGMERAIPEGGYVVSNRLAYQANKPRRGDIVLTDTNLYRIIGMPGETIELFGGHIYIDGKLVQEDYQLENTLTYPILNNESMLIPDNSYYVLCDNRKCYDDSRQGMALSEYAIRGKVLFAFKF